MNKLNINGVNIVDQHYKKHYSLSKQLISNYKRNGIIIPYILVVDNKHTDVFYTVSQGLNWLIRNKYTDRVPRYEFAGVCSLFNDRIKGHRITKPVKNNRYFPDDLEFYIIPLNTEEEYKLFSDEIEQKWFDRIQSIASRSYGYKHYND